jgi:hypothetical protein
MLYKNLLVVSDKFNKFASNKNIITKSDLYDLLKADSLIYTKSQKITLIPGQGFSDRDIQDTKALFNRSKNSRYFDFSLWNCIPSRASKELTHKHNTENILISKPKRTTSNEFTSHLLIDERSEMMADHQTGLHIQGMVLVEAARQLYLAIMEKFILCDYEESLYFVFNNLSVDYCKFNFPLPSQLTAQIIELEKSSEKKKTYIMKIDIIQCGSISASLSLNGTMMPNKVILNIENRFAKQSINSYLAGFEHSEKEVVHA